MPFRSLDFMQFSCESGEQEEERWEQEKCGLSSESRQPTVPAKTNSIVSRGKEAGKKKKKECVAQICFWQLCHTAENMEAPEALLSGPLHSSSSSGSVEPDH